VTQLVHTGASAALTVTRRDRLACRAWIQEHSKSFFLSSLFLPARVRQGAWALYAFCRRADDAVDEGASGSEALRRVDGLRRRLDAAYGAGPLPDHPVDRAFAVTAARYRIPRALPEALLAGMEMDARGATYETDEDLLIYSFRVASTVGLMMTCIMGASDDVAWLRAADLGVAMQLTNIARDVGEDARRGRVYLPRTLLAEVGLEPRDVLTAKDASPPLRQAVERLLARADAHYQAADLGLPLLPRACRFAIASSRLIYSRIGAMIAHNGYDSVTTRAHVRLLGKLALVPRAMGALFSSAGEASRQSVGPADALLARLVADVGLPVPRRLAPADRRDARGTA
jgi:phytoene synthase